jgi:hypothetical protein
MLSLACGRSDDGDANVTRGRGLKVAELSLASEARVFEGAVRAAFDVGPGLTLMLHPRHLPRTTGYEGGEKVPGGLEAALRERGIVQGTCEPVRDGARNTPRCNSPQAGYLVRGSDILRVSPDTVEIYFAAERFGAAKGQRPEALRFEKIYQLVGGGTAWRVAREARSPEGGR